MKHKDILQMLALLITLEIAIFFGGQVHSQTVNFFVETMEYRSGTLHTPFEEYAGPQDVQPLMDLFGVEYNQRYSKTKVIISRKEGGLHTSEFVIKGKLDTRYPRAAWLQLLLDRGVVIESFSEYAFYLSKRHTLAFLEDNDDLWRSGFFGVSPTDDWETYRASYIDKLVEVQTNIKRQKKQVERARGTLERSEKLRPSNWTANWPPRTINPVVSIRAINLSLRTTNPVMLIR